MGVMVLGFRPGAFCRRWSFFFGFAGMARSWSTAMAPVEEGS